MIALLLALGPSAAAAPWLDAYSGVGIRAAGEERTGLLLGSGVSLALAEPVRVEARVEGQVREDGARVFGGPFLRLYMVHPERRDDWRPALILGGGVAGGYRTQGLVKAGLDVDVPTGWPTHARAGVGVTADLEGGWSVGLRVGVVGRPWTRQPTPMLVEQDAPVVEPEPEPVLAEPDRGGWWDPDSCAWVPDDPGDGWQVGDGIVGARAAGAGTDPSAAGTDPAAVEAADVAPVVRPQGWLMVVANPGDVVRLGALDQQVGADGVARLRAPEGVVDVSVIGGGRTQAFEAAIADGYALWLRAAAPEEVRVGFPAGSAVVNAEDRVLIQALARNRGQYALRVSGSYSPEGQQEANLRLAEERAAAVRALLEAAGVPSSGIRIDPPTPPRPGLSAAEQRAVYVQPVAAGGTP